MTGELAVPRFAVGQAVRISAREEPRHHRVPHYALGRRGIVERTCGAFGRPELLADGLSDQPGLTLYRVRIPVTELWGAGVEDPRDSLEIEVYEHWLEAAGSQELER